MKAWKSKTTRVQTLLFPRLNWTRRDAASWARKHGFRATTPDVTDDYIRLRQEDPEQFQKASFRTITLGMHGKKPIKAVVARPWVKVGNPHCVLFDTIHFDWKLHKRKHELFGQLAKQKGTGKFSIESARRKFKPLVMAAARKYRREHKIKPPIRVVFPPEKINRGIDALMKQFGQYWKQGQLDQYLPRSAWSKRQEK
jgi:hypothetical protein